MKPSLKERRIVEVRAAVGWQPTLEQRVYSCPDTPRYDFVLGATCLIFKNHLTGARVPLEVVAAVTIGPDAAGEPVDLAEPLRTRLGNYRAHAGALPGILLPGQPHRFYFLSDEPWPDWLQRLSAEASDTEWPAILSILAEPSRFFEWPQVGSLLWPGCTRVADGHEHDYPPQLTERLGRLGLQPDTRSNGPAIMAFLAAGGHRPTWGNEGWPIHHIYDGTGTVDGIPPAIPHAVCDGRYFTHSAGLVAAHPVAHHFAHESTLLKWLLRREGYLRFGFDPMAVFSTP